MTRGSNKRYRTGCSHQQLKQRCGGSAAQQGWRRRQQAEENTPLRGRDQEVPPLRGRSQGDPQLGGYNQT